MYLMPKDIQYKGDYHFLFPKNKMITEQVHNDDAMKNQSWYHK